MLNDRISQIVKRAATSEDANKSVSSRLINIERERDAIRALLGHLIYYIVDFIYLYFYNYYIIILIIIFRI